MTSSEAAPPSGRDGPHAFVADLDHPVLGDDDHHHLARSLRVRPGAPITISDGRGRWRRARFGDAPEPVGDIVTVPEPLPPVTVGFVLAKGDRPAWVVQKLTELGVDRIQLLTSARSVVRWPEDRVARHLARLRRVIVEAAMQSRRVTLPELEEPRSLAAALSAFPGAALAEPGGAPPSLQRPVVFIGPEGGWDDDERALAPHTVGLGAQVLRAETAAIAAATALTLLRSGLAIEHSA